MTIKELKYTDDNDDLGVLAVSLVYDPAIEENFLYFTNVSRDTFIKVRSGGEPLTPTQSNLEKLRHPDYGWKFWKYETRANLPDTIDTSRDFCVDHVGKIFHITEIRNWSSLISRTPKYQKGWMDQSTFTANFQGKNETNFNLDQQFFNCRHVLLPVTNMNEVISAGKEHLIDLTFNKMTFEFKIENDEKRIISGPVMIPNKMMLRKGLKKKDDTFYVYFSKDSIKKFKDKYGWNRSITFQHDSEITGTSILLDTWLYKTEKDDNCGIKDLKEGSWCMKYKVISDKLWGKIKSGEVKGFSVEILVSVE